MHFKKNLKRAFQNWAIGYVKTCDLNGNSRLFV